MLLALSVLAAPITVREEVATWTAPKAPSTDLVAVARDSLRAWREMGGAGEPALPSGPVDATLQWIVQIGDADALSGADRLADPTFLARCLTTWRWVPDVPREGERLRLTRYLVYGAEGRAAPEGPFQDALWALPHDERDAAGAPIDAEARRATLDRYRYTRQDVAAGVYREGGAAAGHADPLVWLTHEAHEQALMQGTVAVTVDGATRLYNVFRNNGIAYDKRSTTQRRYWYFRLMDTVRGWAREPTRGPELRAHVAVAGDLENVGFGRVLAVRGQDGLRLVVLADTGGAFVDNRHQLDLYTGIHASHAAFQAATAGVGDTAAAWVVGVRDPACE